MSNNAKRAVLGVVVLATALGLSWMSRLKPAPPGFMKADRWELVEDVLYSGFNRPASVDQGFNLHRDIEALREDCIRSNIRFRCQSTPPLMGYRLSAVDENCPIRSIQLTVGRMHWGKSFFAKDNPIAPNYADGWTMVDVVYRPNIGADMRDSWENRILPALGIKPPAPTGVIACFGMRNIPTPPSHPIEPQARRARKDASE